LVGAIESVEAALTDPESAAVCGLLPALSVKTRLAVRVPEADGVKVIVTEQLEPETSVAAHVLLVIAKSVASAPVIAMPLMVSVVAPVLLNVTDFAELVDPIAVFANVTLAGATDTLVVLDPVPVPERAACSAVPLARMLSVAVRAPANVGLKTMPIAQLPPPARFGPHVLLAMEKSPAFAPLIPAAPKVAVDEPLFVSVNV
jgi:hypothetical protein